MKNILRNNSIIITAFVIMIVIVWYLNYTGGDQTKTASGNKLETQQAADETDYTVDPLTENGLELSDLLGDENDLYVTDTLDSDQVDTATMDLETEFTDISDEDLMNMQATNDGTTKEDAMAVSDTGEVVVEDETSSDDVALTEGSDDSYNVAEEQKNTSTPGEAVLASTTINASYFSSAKLTREQNRAKEKETLMSMLENKELSDEVKQEATASMLALNDIMEKENSTELLLEAKGFDGAVVSIIDDSVDVVINAPTITEQEIAQITSIVVRKAGVEADNIVISPVVVED